MAYKALQVNGLCSTPLNDFVSCSQLVLYNYKYGQVTIIRIEIIRKKNIQVVKKYKEYLK